MHINILGSKEYILFWVDIFLSHWGTPSTRHGATFEAPLNKPQRAVSIIDMEQPLRNPYIFFLDEESIFLS